MFTIIEICPPGILAPEHNRRIPITHIGGTFCMVPTVQDRPARIDVHTGVFSVDENVQRMTFSSETEARQFGEKLIHARTSRMMLGHTFEVIPV